MPTIPFSYECSKDAGFVMDPNEQKRFGYIVAFKGFDKVFAKDLKVAVPYNGVTPQYTGGGFAVTPPGPGVPAGEATVVGVIEKFEWNGGVGDPLKFEFYVSQENAMQIKAMQQSALQTTKIQGLAWWIADFDQEKKKWFEQAHPMPLSAGVTGIITGKDNPELDVDLNPVPVKDGIDVNVYKITMGVVPAANKQYNLHFCNTHGKPVVKAWGLVVGTLALGELPADAAFT
jgi:hypothetical protein